MLLLTCCPELILKQREDFVFNKWGELEIPTLRYQPREKNYHIVQLKGIDVLTKAAYTPLLLSVHSNLDAVLRGSGSASIRIILGSHLRIKVMRQPVFRIRIHLVEHRSGSRALINKN